MQLCRILFAFGFLLINARTMHLLPQFRETNYTTSIFEMIELLHLEQMLVNNFRTYATKLQNKINTINRGLDIMQNLTIADESENPLHNFVLLRHLHADWIIWLKILRENVAAIQINYIKSKQNQRPTYADMQEATTGILRIQKAYELNVEDMANGLLDGIQYESKMLTNDCMKVGILSFERKEYTNALFWFHAALERYEPSMEPVYAIQGLRLTELILFYAAVLVKQNLPHMALRTTRSILSEYLPYEVTLQSRCGMWLRSIYMTPKAPKLQGLPRASLTERFCRQKNNTIQSKLYCRYNSVSSAFLQLAPLKLEELHHNPYMVLYHNVIYDNEIASLKARAKPNLMRTTTFDTDTRVHSIDPGRTSNSAFLYRKLPITRRINLRVADMTGLNLCCAEILNIINYGIGGHYGLHHDFFSVSDKERRSTSDIVERYATVLFYLNDVEQGGGTAFPLLNITVQPKKGNAIVWHNLDNAGNGHKDTIHYACPVLVGSKWVMTKWIDEISQIFIKPCLKD